MSRVDDLYRLPLSEFTAARNGLAKELRSQGRRDRAQEIQSLRKPSIPAWIVNHLYFEHRKDFDALRRAAQAQFRALESGTAPSAEALGRRRRSLTELLRHAEEIAGEAGSRWTPALRVKVTRTLEAIANTRGTLSLRPGRLVEALEPAGFDALLGASLAPGSVVKARKAATAPAKDKALRKKKLREARTLRDQAKKDVAAARRKRGATLRRVDQASKRAAQAEKNARAAEARAAGLREEAHQRDVERRQAKGDLDAAQRVVDRTERELANAQRRLEPLERED